MIRTIGFCERNVFPDPPSVVTVAAATATKVLADETNTKFEIAARYIQNIGSGDLYFCENDDGASPTHCHGMLLASGNQQGSFSNSRKAVWVYSTAGTTVATWIERRYDDPQ